MRGSLGTRACAFSRSWIEGFGLGNWGFSHAFAGGPLSGRLSSGEMVDVCPAYIPKIQN